MAGGGQITCMVGHSAAGRLDLGQTAEAQADGT